MNYLKNNKEAFSINLKLLPDDEVRLPITCPILNPDLAFTFSFSSELIPESIDTGPKICSPTPADLFN